MPAGCLSGTGLSLASLSPQLSSVGSDHYGKNNGGPNQWIVRVNITPRLSKIHFSLLGGDV